MELETSPVMRMTSFSAVPAPPATHAGAPCRSALAGRHAGAVPDSYFLLEALEVQLGTLIDKERRGLAT